MGTGHGKAEVVVITGASAGVGRALVRRFARDGAHIGLIARGREGLEAARREVEEAGGKALVLVADVADAAAIEEAAATVERELGPIDIWINNAMASVFSPIKEMTPEEFRRVTEVTYLGYVYGTLAALKRMLPRDEGMIVQVGSALGYRSIPLQSAYCGAKHAIIGFTQSLYSELIHDHSNVRVTQVHLPAVNTPQFGWVKSRLPNKPQPVPPIFQPEVAADAIYDASHNYRREWFLGVPVIKAILANRVIPAFLDYYLAHNAWKGQQTDEPEKEDRASNLWEPLPGDHGAHGSFDELASSISPQHEVNKRRGMLALAGAALITAGAALLAARMSDGKR